MCKARIEHQYLKAKASLSHKTQTLNRLNRLTNNIQCNELQQTKTAIQEKKENNKLKTKKPKKK